MQNPVNYWDASPNTSALLCIGPNLCLEESRFRCCTGHWIVWKKGTSHLEFVSSPLLSELDTHQTDYLVSQFYDNVGGVSTASGDERPDSAESFIINPFLQITSQCRLAQGRLCAWRWRLMRKLILSTALGLSRLRPVGSLVEIWRLTTGLLRYSFRNVHVASRSSVRTNDSRSDMSHSRSGSLVCMQPGNSSSTIFGPIAHQLYC
ncbi:hypothetical protein EJ08DRAFT_468996 [Tothia fuscella]|uniref:Uncharacterized protein n=1 Tax=Tothia fuscella TaxID=1048955 RepID=A0A9P4NY02_9PEZI|nr:hypothetical protein EJ08DRAFT_468996 [Tothia fuscella]